MYICITRKQIDQHPKMFRQDRQDTPVSISKGETAIQHILLFLYKCYSMLQHWLMASPRSQGGFGHTVLERQKAADYVIEDDAGASKGHVQLSSCHGRQRQARNNSGISVLHTILGFLESESIRNHSYLKGMDKAPGCGNHLEKEMSHKADIIR